MSIRASEPIERAQIILNDNDPAFVRWPKDEMLKWLNDGAAEIVIVRPAAGATTRVVALAAGTLQFIPAGGLELLDVTRNIGADEAPGRAITKAARALLDDLSPAWHSLPKKDVVKHFFFDERTPDRYYVYPPVNDGRKAEIVFSRAPDEVSDLDESIEIDRAYMGALVNYLVFRAASKDSEYADASLAIAHQSAFYQTLGVQKQSADEASPNARS